MPTSIERALVVRPATTDDLAAVVTLRLALLREHASNPVYGRLRPDAAERAHEVFAAQLRMDDQVTFLAERGTTAIGILRCADTVGSPLLFPPRYAYISSVYVIPRHRRHGVLRALFGAAEQWASGRGLEEMRLHNAPENPLSSGAWTALGFEVVEHLRMRPIGPR
jgi:ribosomal protein S18 acetylase RimI-like enzyme